MDNCVLTLDRVSKAYPLDVAPPVQGFWDSCTSVFCDLFLSMPVEQLSPRWTVRDVSFSIARGEIVALVGPAGAGKTTLLNLISQAIAPTSGTIRLRGRAAPFLGSAAEFFLELTARENIFARGAALGMTRRDVRKVFGELAELSGVEKFLDTPVKYYSLGMCVRLSFAMVAHLRSDLMLIDETLLYADDDFKLRCKEKMRQLADRQRRAILIVNGAAMADRQVDLRGLCSRAIRMRQGTVVADGAFDDVVPQTTDYQI